MLSLSFMQIAAWKNSSKLHNKPQKTRFGLLYSFEICEYMEKRKRTELISTHVLCLTSTSLTSKLKRKKKVRVTTSFCRKIRCIFISFSLYFANVPCNEKRSSCQKVERDLFFDRIIKDIFAPVCDYAGNVDIKKCY